MDERGTTRPEPDGRPVTKGTTRDAWPGAEEPCSPRRPPEPARCCCPRRPPGRGRGPSRRPDARVTAPTTTSPFPPSGRTTRSARSGSTARTTATTSATPTTWTDRSAPPGRWPPAPTSSPSPTGASPSPRTPPSTGTCGRAPRWSTPATRPASARARSSPSITMSPGGGTDHQEQFLYYSTDGGRTFTHHGTDPVLANPGVADFRDPKVIRDDDRDRWVMAPAERHRIGFYHSADLPSWTYAGAFAEDGIGVLECPDLFRITADDGTPKWVLGASGDGTGSGRPPTYAYWTGSFDGGAFTADLRRAAVARPRLGLVRGGHLREAGRGRHAGPGRALRRGLAQQLGLRAHHTHHRLRRIQRHRLDRPRDHPEAVRLRRLLPGLAPGRRARRVRLPHRSASAT